MCNLQTSDSTGVSISQTITGLVPGTYRLSAMLGTDYGKIVTMFAGDKKVSVGAHDFGLFYLNKAIIDNIEVGDDGKLLIGVEAGDWYKADDFRLVCVKLADDNITDAIVGVSNEQNGLSISSNDGNITISTLDGTHVAIYSITGVKEVQTGVNKLSVDINDDTQTVTKNVDNRIYMIPNNNLNVTLNQAATDFGKVTGMTFFGMYRINRKTMCKRMNKK